MPVEIVSGIRKELIEDAAKRENRGARILARARDRNFPDLAAGSRRPFEDVDIATHACEIHGRREPGDSGTDYRDPRISQFASENSLTPSTHMSILTYSHR